MAYDELFGLPRSSRHVIPRIMDSADNEQFTPGYNSLPTSLNEMKLINHSNSVVQMIEKRCNQSHMFVGIWKTEQRIEENTSEKELEIKNDFSCLEGDFDLGFDGDILKDHSEFWETGDSEPKVEGNLGSDSLEANHEKGNQHTPETMEFQSNLHVHISKQGNTADESGDETLQITEVSGENVVEYTHHQLGYSDKIYGDLEKSSVCTDPNLDNVSSTKGGTLRESGTQKNVSQTGKNLDLNKKRGLDFESNISAKHSRETETDSTSDDVQSSKTMKAESTEENNDEDTPKTPPDKIEQSVHVTSDRTPSSGGTDKGQEKTVKETQSKQSWKSASDSNKRIFAARQSQESQDGDAGWDFPDNLATNKAACGTCYNKTYGWNKTGNIYGTGNYSFGSNSFYAYVPTTYFTYHTRAMEDFAEANGLELHDVEADGSCMFRAVEDQMRINAEFGHTAKSIRWRAVEYLRQNPVQEDGSHLRNFLSSKETWEQYLSRMERNSCWGDHLTLKAISEAFGKSIVIFNIGKDIRRTELIPKVSEKSNDTQFFLGHIGEYHYLSLRPKTWEKTWPLQAQVYREKWTQHQLLTKYIEAKLDSLELKRKIANYENIITQNRKMLSILSLQGDINDSEAEPPRVLPAVCLPHRSSNEEISEDEERRLNDQLSRVQAVVTELPNGFVYKGWITQENEDNHHLLVTNPLHIDPESGVPLPHLTFILRFWIKDSIQLPVNIAFPDTSKPVPDNCIVEYAGSSCDGSNAYLPDRTENGVSNISSRFPSVPIKIFCRKDIIVKFKTNVDKKENEVFVDESQTHPGYCRLRPSVESSDLWGSQLFYMENDCFIKQSDPIDSEDLREYHGFQSHEWIPSRTDWATRPRPSLWPSDELREKIQKAGVIFIHRPHIYSQVPNVEWQIIFSKAEKEIFLNVLSPSQKDNYNIFKVLVDYQTKHCKFHLTPSHIKAVFLRAMEWVPLTSWENNTGGCLLYLLNLLSTFLGKGNIPHYFISENNMIDHVPAESARELKLHVDTIKHFPFEVLKFCFEKHGITETGLSKILGDLDRYRMGRDIFWTLEHVFLDVLQTLTSYCRDHYNFQRALDLICQAYLLHQQMSQATNTSNTVALEVFISKALANCQEVERYKMLRMIDDLYNTKLSSMGLTEDTVYIKSLLEEEIESEFCNMPIPVDSVGNKGHEAKLLEDIATTCNFLKKNSESLVFIKTAISLLKKALHEDILDVSEVEDANLKLEIGRKNVKLTTSLNNLLAGCYQKLSTCCVASQQQELMYQYMPEIEAFAERMPKMVSFVEKMWTQLGQAEKGREFKRKHSGFHKNNWGQNDYDDDID